MANPGRKRKFRGYDPATSTQSKLNELNAREAKKARLHVLNQPHRRDDPDPEHPWLASALGRLCRAQKLDPALYEAGQEYCELVGRFQAAWGIDGRQQDGTAGGVGDRDIPPHVVHAWRTAITEIEGEWLRLGVLATMGILLRADLDLPTAAASHAVRGLEALAIRLGIFSPAVNT